MLTISHVSRCIRMYSVHFYIAIFQMFAVSHISPCRGKNMCLFTATFQMFTVWHMSPEGVNMFSFIYQYFKCLLFGIYSRVGVNNMCTFIAILYNNVCCSAHVNVSGSMFALLYGNIFNIYCLAYIPMSG